MTSHVRKELRRHEKRNLGLEPKCRNCDVFPHEDYCIGCKHDEFMELGDNMTDSRTVFVRCVKCHKVFANGTYHRCDRVFNKKKEAIA